MAVLKDPMTAKSTSRQGEGNTFYFVGLRRARPDEIPQSKRYFNDETGIRRGGIALQYLSDEEGLPDKKDKYWRAILTRRIPTRSSKRSYVVRYS